jgi:hypothetical protein
VAALPHVRTTCRLSCDPDETASQPSCVSRPASRRLERDGDVVFHEAALTLPPPAPGCCFSNVPIWAFTIIVLRYLLPTCKPR